MWGKPQVLRIMTYILLGVSVLLVGYHSARYALNLSVFKLRTIQLVNTPVQVDIVQLNRLIKKSVGGSFFTIDIEQTRRTFEQLPWVRKVSIRRQFPWGLEVELEEHVPMARWNDTALVNNFGEVFEGQSNLELPAFNGEPDTSNQMAAMYVNFNAELAEIRKSIVEIDLSPRFAWKVRLDNNMVLELGRENMEERLTRFVKVYPYSLATMKGKVNYVDLRYRNGFSVYQTGNVSMTDGLKQNSANKV